MSDRERREIEIEIENEQKMDRKDEAKECEA